MVFAELANLRIVRISSRSVRGAYQEEVAVTPAGIPITAHANGETAGKTLPDGSAAGLGHIPVGIPFNVKVGLQVNLVVPGNLTAEAFPDCKPPLSL